MYGAGCVARDCEAPCVSSLLDLIISVCRTRGRPGVGDGRMQCASLGSMWIQAHCVDDICRKYQPSPLIFYVLLWWPLCLDLDTVLSIGLLERHPRHSSICLGRASTSGRLRMSTTQKRERFPEIKPWKSALGSRSSGCNSVVEAVTSRAERIATLPFAFLNNPATRLSVSIILPVATSPWEQDDTLFHHE